VTKQKESSAHILTQHEILTRRMVGGRPLLREILGQTDPLQWKC